MHLLGEVGAVGTATRTGARVLGRETAAAGTGVTLGEKAAARAMEGAATRTGAATRPVVPATTTTAPRVPATRARIAEETGGTTNVARPSVRENVARANEKPYAFTSDTFQARTEWTAPVGTQQTYTVHQRADIDWNLVRTRGGHEFRGKTNLEAAKAGHAPRLADGSRVDLHHIGQDARGPLVEASERSHAAPLHRQFSGQAHPEHPVNRRAFDSEREAYWKWRAENAE